MNRSKDVLWRMCLNKLPKQHCSASLKIINKRNTPLNSKVISTFYKQAKKNHKYKYTHLCAHILTQFQRLLPSV